MSKDGNKMVDDFSLWMDKFFPVDTVVIDMEGHQYLVASWFILRDQVYVKLVQGAGKNMTVYNVVFDEVMRWARFPPGHQLMGSPDFEKKTSTVMRNPPLVDSFNKLRADIERSTGFLKSQVARVFKPRTIGVSVSGRANPYRCVSIKYPCNHVCEVVLKIKTLPYLSDTPPLFLETELRFLLSEGITLPLPGCNIKSCQCRFIHHQDRRVHDRRGHRDLILPLLSSTNSERRVGNDRRSRPGPST